jgi:hypothetical protein
MAASTATTPDGPRIAVVRTGDRAAPNSVGRLDDPRCRVVAVCDAVERLTPAHPHHERGVAAPAPGTHVSCQKPLTHSPEGWPP